MAFIAGAYTWTYDSNALGTMEQTPQLDWVPGMETITDDAKGDTIVDGVYRGGNMYLTMVLNEFNSGGALAAFHPQSATFGALGTPGVLLSTFAKVLVGTAIAGTNVTPSATFTANKAVLAPGQNISLLLGTRKRNVPVRFLLLPYDNSGSDVFFVGA